MKNEIKKDTEWQPKYIEKMVGVVNRGKGDIVLLKGHVTHLINHG